MFKGIESEPEWPDTDLEEKVMKLTIFDDKDDGGLERGQGHPFSGDGLVPAQGRVRAERVGEAI